MKKGAYVWAYAHQEEEKLERTIEFNIPVKATLQEQISQSKPREARQNLPEAGKWRLD